MKRFFVYGAFVFLGCIISAFAEDIERERAGEVPFPGALEQANISQDRLDSVLEHSLILGNGDINGLLYSESGNLVLRLSKNDVWDARLDTSNDPPLLPMRRIKELAKDGSWPVGGSFGGGWLNPDGTVYRGPNSWEKPYPCPIPCGKVVLGNHPKKPVWRQIRAQGRENSWTRDGNVSVMSIEGDKGASNGYAFGPIEISTDNYQVVHVRVCGTINAKYFVEVLDTGGVSIMSSKWQDSPGEFEEKIFKLPAEKTVDKLILYAWTDDGKGASNRFESVVFMGKDRNLEVDLYNTDFSGIQSTLDVCHAVATVLDDNEEGETKVRALARRNVFLIESKLKARLVADNSGVIPPADEGREGKVSYVLQKVPGDADWGGMSFAVALNDDGHKKAIAIVTSHESQDVVSDAVELVRSTIRNDRKVVEEHIEIWKDFWSASGIEIDDEFLSKAWYRNLYFLRCVSKSNVEAVGLYAGLVQDGIPQWHGGHTTNYNAQQTFWSSFNTNHVELSEPYVRLISEYLPRAKWLCNQLFESEGAYYPHNLFNFESGDPENCKSNVGRQQFYVSWSYTIGVSGFAVQNLWLRYKYQPDLDYLENVAYPAIRDVSVFYANFIDQCQVQKDGKVELAPSVSPEHWGWTKDFAKNRNCTFDIAFTKYTLEAAIEAASILNKDRKLILRFKQALNLLPGYPTTKGRKPVVVDVEDAPPINYNIAVPAVPVFPSDVVTWWSDPEEKELFRGSIENLQWNGNNSTFILGVSRARLSMPDSSEWIKKEIKARLRPNGTITLNRLGHHFNNNGHYTEQFAASMAIGELLLQSVGDKLRVFPAWPEDKPARFHNLRAQGGFLVSAAKDEKCVQEIKVLSTVGGKLQFLSPWPAIKVKSNFPKNIIIIKPDQMGIVTIDTKPGEKLIFLSKN